MTNEERASHLLENFIDEFNQTIGGIKISEFAWLQSIIAAALDEAEKRGAILYDGCKELLDMANTTIAELYAKLDQEKMKPHIVIDALQRENAELKESIRVQLGTIRWFDEQLKATEK